MTLSPKGSLGKNMFNQTQGKGFFANKSGAKKLDIIDDEEQTWNKNKHQISQEDDDFTVSKPLTLGGKNKLLQTQKLPQSKAKKSSFFESMNKMKGGKGMLELDIGGGKDDVVPKKKHSNQRNTFAGYFGNKQIEFSEIEPNDD